MRYSLFGLSVSSQVEMPLLKAYSEAPVDVQVKLGRVIPGPTSIWQINDPVEFSCTRAASGVVLDWPGMRYGVSADQVVVDSQHLRSAVIPLMQAVWSVLLTMNGREALHASVVAKDEVAVAIVGASGSGKSTAALALLDRGWSLIADDLLTLDGGGRAIPGPPFIRLMPDRAKGREGELDATGKLRYRPTLVDGPKHLTTVLVHGEYYSGVRQLRGIEAIDGLLSNLYNDVLMFDDQAPRRLDFCADIVRRVPVYGVPPRSLSVEQVEQVVEQALVIR